MSWPTQITNKTEEPPCGCNLESSAPIRGGYEHEKDYIDDKGQKHAGAADDWGLGGAKGFSISDFYSGGKTQPSDGTQPGTDMGSLTTAIAAESIVALNVLSTDTGECSESVVRRTGEPCSSTRVAAAVKEFVDHSQNSGVVTTFDESDDQHGTLPKSKTTEAKAIRTAAKVLGCTSESCVVTHPKFRSFVTTQGAGLDKVGGVNVLDVEISRRFKTQGPRDSTQLLSNFNIDGVLQEWAASRKDFYNFSFNMIDFETTGGSLARTDVANILEGRAPQNLGTMGGIVERPCTTFACVLNTDVSTGRGKHWVAVFGDCRGKDEWSVEYFNSAGNPPPPAITRWLEETAARLSEFRASHPRKFGNGPVNTVSLTDVRHQNSKTECGNYTLYYIRRRLEGAPHTEFMDKLIPDAAMVAFRKHIFRSGN